MSLIIAKSKDCYEPINKTKNAEIGRTITSTAPPLEGEAICSPSPGGLWRAKANQRDVKGGGWNGMFAFKLYNVAA